MRARRKNGYWAKEENKREFLQQLAVKWQIKGVEEWKKVKWRSIKKEGGSGLLNSAKNISEVLSIISPEYFRDYEKRKPCGYWDSKENQIKELERIYEKENLQSLDDWKKLSHIKARKIINRTLLMEYYQNKMSLLLHSLYPNYPWGCWKEKKQNGYWDNVENHRSFLTSLYSKLQFKSMDELNNKKLILQYGGRLLLNRYSSLESCLSTLYPDYDWKFEIPTPKRKHGYWHSIDHQIQFMKELFIQLNLSSEEWALVTWKEILNQKGGSNLHRIYSGNLQKLFRSLFPSHHYKSEHLIKLKVRNKLLKLQTDFQIQRKEDWYRIRSFNLFRYLTYFHPAEKWLKSNFNFRGKKSSQRSLRISLQKLFPNQLLLEDYYHPHLLSNLTQSQLEIDIFIPALNCAFEYQGVHHYDEMASNSFGSFELYQSRDQEKEKICRSKSISLIRVPYWWDHSSPLPPLFQ